MEWSKVPPERWSNFKKYEEQKKNNMSPGQSFPVLFCDKNGERSLSTMKWGLVPKFLPLGTKVDHYKMFNARIETLESKASFRQLVKNQRCVLILNGFFEWKVMALCQKQPHYICRKDGTPLTIACVYEERNNEDGESLITFSIVTRPSGVDMKSIHDREPVFLSESEVEEWIDNSTPPPRHIMHPLPTSTDAEPTQQELLIFPVNSRVTSVSYQEDDVCVPIKQGASIAAFFAPRSTPLSALTLKR